MTRRLKSPLYRFPWATAGRRESHSDIETKLGEQRQFIPLFRQKPVVSVGIPILEELSEFHFEQCLESLAAQSYPHWQAVVMSAKPRPRLKLLVEQRKDERLFWVDDAIESQIHNEMAPYFSGDWAGFLEPDAVLNPATLFKVVREANLRPTVDLFYCNEVTIDKNSKKLSNYLSRSRASWFNLIHFNCIGDFWFVRKRYFDRLLGFQYENVEIAIHDFLLRLYENTTKFGLLPYYLYCRREKEGKQKDISLLQPIIQAHLKRTRKVADVWRDVQNDQIKVTPHLPREAKVSVITCFRDHADWTIKCVKQLADQAHKVELECFLVNNQSNSEQLSKVQKSIDRFNFPISIIDYNAPFNFAHMHNLVISQQVKGEYILLLNNDVFWKSKNAIDEMVAWAQFDWVGTVGCKLLFPDGRIQHGGFRGVFGGFNRLARVHHAQNQQDFLSENREVFGNTFAACMVKRSTYSHIGGLRELEFPNGHGDLAFNFECLKRGLHNLYLGHLEAIHLESASRGLSYEYWEECGIEREYPDILQRMLREDLGYDRIPMAKIGIKTFLKSGLAAKLAENVSWLDALKPTFKRVFSRVMSQA